MKKTLLCVGIVTFLLSCNNDKDKAATTGTMDSTAKTMTDLPYKASYSSSWSQDVSDADLKTVLMTYKDWSDGNISGLTSRMADSIAVDMYTGDHMWSSRADLAKFWTNFRDSLSSVKIDMQSWQKMYSTDKKESYILTWYDETDTYKTGKVDSATYHDINQVKDGKITWYSTYKRPKK